MTSKNYLSTKRNKKLSFSASDALIDWIKRYVNKMNKENPDDERYKSVSFFIYTVLEKVLEIFEKGKNLEDFDEIPDKNISNFYEEITFKAIIPVFEEAIEFHRFKSYKDEDLNLFFLAYKSFIFKDVDPNELSHKDIVNLFERAEKFVKNNKLTEHFTAYFDNDVFIVEYRAKYSNLHYELSKIFAGLLGIFGVKVNKIDYIDKFVQYQCEFTDLFNTKRLKIKERKSLARNNINLFIQLNLILEEKSEFLWMDISHSPTAIISFNNLQSALNFFDKKISELKEIVNHSKFNLYLLKILNHLHWIQIEDEQNLEFKILLNPNENVLEYELMQKILNEHLIDNINSQISY